jgi:RNA polymerase sigma-70 factor (ECF subfamily)
MPIALQNVFITDQVLHYASPAERVRTALLEKRQHLLAFVRRYAGDLVDAEDVLQRATERALERSHQLRDPARAHAWVSRIVRNVLADELRGRRERPVDIQQMELAAPEPDEAPCRCSLALVHTLKPEYTDILSRVLIEGRPVIQVAREMSITPNNAMVRLHRARQALRARLLEHCGTTSVHTCQTCPCTVDGCCVEPEA